MNSTAINNLRPTRLGYIDALRGVSMILVVFAHTLLRLGLPIDATVVGGICITFRMPLFFFISGFFAYRTLDAWSLRLVANITTRKVKAQIVGLFFFYTLFQLCSHRPVLMWLHHGFSWFWFTAALFQMFLLYIVLVVFFKCVRVKHAPVYVDIILVSLAVGFFILNLFKVDMLVSRQIPVVFEWAHVTEYFQYFVFGMLCRKHFAGFTRLIEKDWVRTLAIVLFVVSLVAAFRFEAVIAGWSKPVYVLIRRVIARYSGLMALFILFYGCREYFASGNKVSNALSFIGQRTLDIYMLHMFFMPTLEWVGPYISKGANMVLVEITVALTIAMLDIAVCLIVSRLLRTSRLLAQWLFGSKPEPTKSTTPPRPSPQGEGA